MKANCTQRTGSILQMALFQLQTYHAHPTIMGDRRRKKCAKFTTLIHHSLNIFLLLFYNSLTITFSFFYDNFFFFWKQDLRSWFFTGTCCKNKLRNEQLTNTTGSFQRLFIHSFTAWYTPIIKVYLIPFPPSLHTSYWHIFHFWNHSLTTTKGCLTLLSHWWHNSWVTDRDVTLFKEQCTIQPTVKAVQIPHSRLRKT